MRQPYVITTVAGQRVALLNDTVDPSLVDLPVQCESLTGRITYLPENGLLETRAATGLPVYGVWQIFADQLSSEDPTAFLTGGVRWFHLPAADGGVAVTGDLNEDLRAILPGLSVHIAHDRQVVNPDRTRTLPPLVRTPLEYAAENRRKHRRMLAAGAITLGLVASGFASEHLIQRQRSVAQLAQYQSLQQHEQSLQEQIKQLRFSRLVPNAEGYRWLAPLIMVTRDWPSVEINGLSGSTSVATAVLHDVDAHGIDLLKANAEWIASWETLANGRIQIKWQGSGR